MKKYLKISENIAKKTSLTILSKILSLILNNKITLLDAAFYS